MIYLSAEAIKAIQEKTNILTKIGLKAVKPLTKSAQAIQGAEIHRALKHILKSTADSMDVEVKVSSGIKTGTPLTKEYAKVENPKDRNKLISAANPKAKEWYNKRFPKDIIKKPDRYYRFEPNKDDPSMIDVRWK